MDRPISPLKRRGLRLLRWLRWAAIVLACLVLGIPTLQALFIRYRVLSAVRSAEFVRLERFEHDGSVPARVELVGKQREKIAAAMPLLPDIGVPGLIALCFVPRHRIVALAPSGEEMEFLVCFECSEVGYGGWIHMTPVFWRSSLRRLFTDHGIPVEEREERYFLS